MQTQREALRTIDRNLRRIAHREEMRARRERQRSRAPGFEAVPSKRNAALFQTFMLEEMMQGTPVHLVEALAWQRLARQLPPPPMERRALPLARPRPSRSDDPAYRKSFVRDLQKRAG